MRVNVYEEELTDRIAVDRNKLGFVGVCFYTALPVTVDGKQVRGPFIHRPGDDDSSGVTFFAKDKQKLRDMLTKAIAELEKFNG